MADTRGNPKDVKRDEHAARDVIDEVAEETKPGGTKPRVENPNRDRARGDWDRTGDHHDEDENRAEE